MKKLLTNILIICGIIACLSVTYYFLIFLPKQTLSDQKKLDEISKEVRKNTPKPVDTYKLEEQMEELNYAQQRQEREGQMQRDCESNNGFYGGNGLCTYYPQ
jgi:hypothetical protein